MPANWTEPEYTRAEYKRAGRELRQQAVPVADATINNWRSSHSYPLNQFYMVLKSRARKVNPNSYVSQRLKRLNSIYAKLVREPAMQLVTMQDIAGCRAILPTLADAKNLMSLYGTMDMPHEFDHAKDYVGSPKNSGYRSYHLIYRFKSDVRTAYEDMRIEIQIRSALQHAWATALETIDLFTRQALKSSQGSQDWERFFVLMSSAIARKEKCPEVAGTPSGKHLVDEIKLLNESLGVIERLRSYKRFREILNYDEQKRHAYVVLKTNIEKNEAVINTWGFDDTELERAQEFYYLQEAKQNGEVVLVAASRTRNIRRAFPNFFADTDVFIRELQEVVGPR
jgi:hypothetical protein